MEYATAFAYQGRTNVPRYCTYDAASGWTTGAVYAHTTVNQALIKKRITGPGMAPLEWSYSTTGGIGEFAPCTVCSTQKTTLVREPNGATTRHTFGTVWRVNEGQLLAVDEGWNGQSALRTTQYRYRAHNSNQRYPKRLGESPWLHADFMAQHNLPQDIKSVYEQGVGFHSAVFEDASGFDELARPVRVSLYSGLGFSKVHRTAYHDHAGLWVLGQTAQLLNETENIVLASSTFNANTALPESVYQSGQPVKRLGYHADGTLASLTDPAGKTVLFSDYARGGPQRAQFADNTFASRSINNLGGISRTESEVGSVHTYSFDAMGRISVINYPPDGNTTYHPTVQSFWPYGDAQFGLPSGHWQQTVTTGNGVVKRWFDAFWRVRVEMRTDTKVGGRTSFVETRYDSAGRVAFKSYPQSTFSSVDVLTDGEYWVYDDLGRMVRHTKTNGSGPGLVTATAYLAGFEKAVTNPRGFVTRYRFQAYDNPGEAHILQIQAPQDVWMDFTRNSLGQASTVTRRGPGVAASRYYVYDDHRRVCKTVEPESLATVERYDLSGNLEWRASGLSLTGLGGCDHDAVPENRKIRFVYDPRNRLTQTLYGDGSPSIFRSYELDGLPKTVTTENFGWSYNYSKAGRLLEAERLDNWQQSMSFSYENDAHRQRAAMVYPSGPRVEYKPDAFGKPTELSGYVSAVRFHPNGALAGYTAANGLVHNVTLNPRGLPEAWTHGNVVNDLYTYDANGNVSAIEDRVPGGRNSRTMGYDGLDRLTSTTGLRTPGGQMSAVYGYDALDNLTSSTVGSRALTHEMDAATNRLKRLSGSLQLDILYDSNGNLRQRGSQAFEYDIGNRMKAATGVANYTYDGFGRRAWMHSTTGRTVLRAYGQSGRLLLTQDSLRGTTHHIHLGDKVVAETNSVTGTRWLHTDALGSPVAATGAGGAVLERTYYEPYGKTADGTDPQGIGYTGHVNDPETGLVYMQQRYYEPIAGRFLSVDPVVSDSRSGSFFNRYLYALNNPYAYTDPTGECGSRIGGEGSTCKTVTFDEGSGGASAAKTPPGGSVPRTFSDSGGPKQDYATQARTDRAAGIQESSGRTKLTEPILVAKVSQFADALGKAGNYVVVASLFAAAWGPTAVVAPQLYVAGAAMGLASDLMNFGLSKIASDSLIDSAAGRIAPGMPGKAIGEAVKALKEQPF